jgi:hypothetical protein
MSSITPSSKVLIGHPTFSRSLESHGSARSADTTSYGWRRGGTIGSEDVGTQTEHIGSGGSISSNGRTLLSELRRRREDAIVDIGLESMKYNGGIYFKKKKKNLPRIKKIISSFQKD